MKLLLLHGAIGAGSQLQPLAQAFAKQYDIHILDFSGHGTKNIGEYSFSIQLFAADVLLYLDEQGVDKISIFGYSMGGYVAMYLARHYPERINKIITLATKYEWSQEIAAKEIKMLDPEKIAQKLPQFAQTLNERHTAIGWEDVLNRTAEMMVGMGAENPLTKEDYPHIPHTVLVALGDRDKMVGMEETITAYQSLPNAQLCILPNTGHPIEHLNVELMADIAVSFLGK